jgi:hypothetical protein
VPDVPEDDGRSTLVVSSVLEGMLLARPPVNMDTEAVRGPSGRRAMEALEGRATDLLEVESLAGRSTGLDMLPSRPKSLVLGRFSVCRYFGRCATPCSFSSLPTYRSR